MNVEEYFETGSRTIVSVTACDDFTLLIRFDNNEVRRLDMKPVLETGGVFEPFRDIDAFRRVD